MRIEGKGRQDFKKGQAKVRARLQSKGKKSTKKSSRNFRITKTEELNTKTMFFLDNLGCFDLKDYLLSIHSSETEIFCKPFAINTM